SASSGGLPRPASSVPFRRPIAGPWGKLVLRLLLCVFPGAGRYSGTSPPRLRGGCLTHHTSGSRRSYQIVYIISVQRREVQKRPPPCRRGRFPRLFQAISGTRGALASRHRPRMLIHFAELMRSLQLGLRRQAQRSREEPTCHHTQNNPERYDNNDRGQQSIIHGTASLLRAILNAISLYTQAQTTPWHLRQGATPSELIAHSKRTTDTPPAAPH